MGYFLPDSCNNACNLAAAIACVTDVNKMLSKLLKFQSAPNHLKAENFQDAKFSYGLFFTG
jgi:hypothetical protein